MTVKTRMPRDRTPAEAPVIVSSDPYSAGTPGSSRNGTPSIQYGLSIRSDPCRRTSSA